MKSFALLRKVSQRTTGRGTSNARTFSKGASETVSRQANDGAWQTAPHRSMPLYSSSMRPAVRPCLSQIVRHVRLFGSCNASASNAIQRVNGSLTSISEDFELPRPAQWSGGPEREIMCENRPIGSAKRGPLDAVHRARLGRIEGVQCRAWYRGA